MLYVLPRFCALPSATFFVLTKAYAKCLDDMLETKPRAIRNGITNIPPIDKRYKETET